MRAQGMGHGDTECLHRGSEEHSDILRHTRAQSDTLKYTQVTLCACPAQPPPPVALLDGIVSPPCPVCHHVLCGDGPSSGWRDRAVLTPAAAHTHPCSTWPGGWSQPRRPAAKGLKCLVTASVAGFTYLQPEFPRSHGFYQWLCCRTMSL